MNEFRPYRTDMPAIVFGLVGLLMLMTAISVVLVYQADELARRIKARDDKALELDELDAVDRLAAATEGSDHARYGNDDEKPRDRPAGVHRDGEQHTRSGADGDRYAAKDRGED